MNSVKTTFQKKIFSVIFAICSVVIFSVSAFAQESQSLEAPPAAEPGIVLPTMEDLDALIDPLKKARDQQTNEEQKKQFDTLVNIYEKAKVQLLEAQKLQTSIADFQDARKKAPERLAAIMTQIEQITAEAKLQDSPEEAPLAQVEQRLTELEAELALAKKNAADSEAEAKQRAERRTEIPQASVRAKEKLENLRRELSLKPAPEVAADLARALQVLLLLTENALARELESYQEEILSYDARRDLLVARRDLAARQVAHYDKRVKQWQEILAAKRKAKAEQDVSKARQASRQVAQSHPAIRALAEENTRMAEQRTGPVGLVAVNAVQAAEIKKIKKQLADLESDFQSITDKAKVVGLTDVIGVILLGKRDDLPDISKHQRTIKARRTETSKARFEWIKYDEQYTELADMEAAVDTILQDAKPPIDPAEHLEMGEEIKTLLETRRELLKALTDEYEMYLSQLADLDVMERQLLAKTKDYANYIDENILWVKNNETLNLLTFPQASRAFVWLLSSQGWWQVLSTLGRDLKATPFVYGIAGLLSFFLFLSRHRVTNRIREISDLINKKYSDRFGYTIQVFVFTVMLSVFFPAVLLFLGWRLGSTYQESEFVDAVAAGCRASALIYLVLAFVRLISMPRGLAEVHFSMSENSMSFVRKHVSWFMPCMIPLVFVMTMIQRQSIGAYKESLGRWTFMAALIALSLFLTFMIRPSGRLLKPVRRRQQGGWLDRLRYVWFPVFMIVPLALALFAALGYYYAAQQLAACLQATLLWIFCLVVAFGFTMRWLIVAQNKLTIKKELQRLAVLSAEEKTERQSNDIQKTQADLLTSEEDIYQISLTMRRFMGTLFVFALFIGLWIIWNDVLPALGIFRRVELWKTTIAEQTISITLSNLSLALIIVFITIIAARNVPGLLKLVILERLPLERGVRFAVVTLTRYIIVVIGMVMAFGEIGIGWSKVQWLVAAISVGLGFGLQEIFANFVSGLIILFEQPMRVGDIVTAGDVSGKVTRIRIRATTIRKWDQKELVVPNKEFIMGRLINWTLSDTILRMNFPVGIAYGSDTALTEKTLLEIAANHQKVLPDPAPFVIFKGFGNSALDFELRLYIPNLDSYLTVWHEVNLAIDNAFRKAAIEIAFPQRDLHIRSIKPVVPIELKKREKEPGE